MSGMQRFGPPESAPPPAAPVGESDVLGRIIRFFEPFDQPDETPVFERTLTRVAGALCGAMEANLATIWVPDPTAGHLRLACSTLQREDVLPEELSVDDSRAGRAVRSAQAQFYPTLECDPPAAKADVLKRMGYEEMWCVPLIAPSLRLPRHVAALTTVHSRRGANAGALDLRFVRFCGERAGHLIEGALWAEQDAVVQQVYRAMGGIDQGVWRVMDEVAKTIAELLHFAACTVALVTDQTLKALRVIGTTGIASEKPRQEWVYEFGEGVTGRVAAENRIIATEDIDSEPWSPGPARFPDVVDGKRPRQFLGAPIRSPDGRVLGVIRLRNKHQPENTSWQRRLNYLDSIRIERVARVIAPLLSLIAEKLYHDTVLKRIRHDQKAPANMIRDFASYYSRMPRGELVQQLDGLYQGLEDCASLADLVAINADLTRIDIVSGIELRPEKDYLLSGFVAKVCKMFRRVCREKGLKGPYLNDDFKAIPKLWVDPVLMQIALYNLLDNAVKYAHTDTEVRVASEAVSSEQGTRYHIHVMNWGIGIQEPDRERVFERGFRTVEARARSVSGLGLGLTIARAIVARHHGTLSVTNLSNPTTLTIDLPGVLATRAPQ